jgi:CubicO group peptidase (beta-lactamase class C family)
MENVHGTYDPAFRAVADVFQDNIAAGRELGAALALVVEGRTVVDLWGGYVDADRARPWERDTVVNVFSVGKGVTALAAHQLAAGGLLDLESPVSRYWPEFGAAGKEGVTVAQLLDHSAGLPAVREILPAGTLYNWDAFCAALTAETPWWEPGTQHGYHVITFGFLVGEVLRRASGKNVRNLVREEIAAPLGLDLFIGLPEEADGRAADLLPPEPAPVPEDHPMQLAMRDPASMTALAFTNPRDLVERGVASMTRWRRAIIPAANAHANALALARMYGTLVAGTDGSRLLAPAQVKLAAAERVRGEDLVLHAPTGFGLGFMLPSELRPFSPNPRAFGHPGAGGALGFADGEARLGFGYTPNRLITAYEGGDPRWPAMIGAVYKSL